MNREKTNPNAPDIRTGPQDGADIVEEASAESFPSGDGRESPGSVESDIERVARAEESEKADLENRLLRALAELENFRRRAERERVLQDAFAKHGISKIQPPLGDPFDPHRHQALTEVGQRDYPAARSSKFCCRATPITSACCARLWSSLPNAGANRRRPIEAAAGHLCRTSGSFRILRR